VGIDRVLAEAGAAKASLYQHFGCKDELVGVVEWAESKDFRGCPFLHTVSELTDAAHPACAIAHDQREWFTERFLEWTKAAGAPDPKATARALVVLFDGAIARSEIDGPQRASDARWLAKKLLSGC
jgi:AcrR family transcriptional regulator